MPGSRSFGSPRPSVALACGSTSASNVLQPASAMQAATLTAVVVLPTPPFWLTIAKTVPTVDRGYRPERSSTGSSGVSAGAVSAPSRPGAGIRPAWARSCARPPDAAPAPRGTARPRAPPRPPCPSSAAAAPPSRSSSASRCPFHATRTPPSRRSGAAYSSSTFSGARARAVTTSQAPMPSRHSSARAVTTSAFASPMAAMQRSMNAPLRPTLSTSTTRASGRAAASGSPGMPAPAPRSASSVAWRTASRSRATSESARWRSTPRSGSTTVVGAFGSAASRSSSVARACRPRGAMPYASTSSARRFT